MGELTAVVAVATLVLLGGLHVQAHGVRIGVVGLGTDLVDDGLAPALEDDSHP